MREFAAPTRYLSGALMFVALLIAGCGGAATGGCTLPPSAPTLAGTPFPTQPIPAGAATSAAVTVIVKVVLASNGALTSASVIQSSHDAVIDAAALKLVQQSTFSPGSPGCGSGAPNTLNVSVSFSPNA